MAHIGPTWPKVQQSSPERSEEHRIALRGPEPHCSLLELRATFLNKANYIDFLIEVFKVMLDTPEDA